MVRSAVGRCLRPLLAALDRRLEQLAVRLELHTQNLSAQQRAELAQLDDRVKMSVAVMSEHVVGIERLARRVLSSDPSATSPASATPAVHAIIAQPGEALVLPPGVNAEHIIAFAPQGDGTWAAASAAGEHTLRIAQLVARRAE
jgi:hypothetical protein